MSAYEGLSFLYDQFMQDAPYAAWDAWLKRHFQLESLDLVDIGCGTGRLTLTLASRCNAVIGVDKSEDMLTQAAQQAATRKLQVQWLCQDMREIKLPRRVDVAISTCDCLNYLLTEEDLFRCFQQVRHCLSPQGWFCFDILGYGRLRTLEEGFWYDLQPEAAVLFETTVNDQKSRIDYEVHAFISEDGHCYRRVEEHHEQAFHEREMVISLLESCGFAVRSVLGDFGASSLEESDRWVFAAQKRD